MWIQILTRGQINPDTWTDCKLGYYLFDFGRHYSSMLLVLMSVEKCYAVYFPLKSKTVCTVRTAKWSTGIVGVMLAGYNLHWFVIVEKRVSMSTGLYGCVGTDHYHYTFDFVNSVLYSFGAFVLMFLTNIAIAFKFMSAKCRRNQSNSTESTNQALVKAATRGTALVVTVSATFLILTAPSAVDLALFNIIDLSNNPVYHVFMNITQYLNHSINGVLYIIVGSKFRMELLKIFCGKKMDHSMSVSHSVNKMSLVGVNKRGA